GEPFGCLVGDYYFDHSPQDVELLGEMAKIGAASHCPFIAGTAPSVMQMEGYRVSVVDDCRAGATAAGMGHLVCMDDNPAELALSAYSLRLWREVTGRMPQACAWRGCGTLWLGTDNWTTAFLHPQAVAAAKAAGYLIASYD
ncbi:type VI secretion system contractile sheath large subunit, partial [Serratia ureilytica]|nr:type VI secretion system contractile sheath large subunit [Serratia ureilytica]